ncbi:MAG TPA: inositol monophosphatase [Stellaceae bacterium]|nr:inositol monophosphatase [Stellaceae bacterium]
MIDLTSIAAFVRATALAEIVPRFRALAQDDIREKRPGDLVTVADVEAERALSRGLEALVPGSVALGEEGVFADPSRLELIAGDRPVWIIDPVDGTGNFAKGRPDFAVIVAYVERGATTAGWIYDPLGDVLVAARRGGGAWCGGQRLRVADAAPSEAITGSAYGRTPAGERAAQALAGSGRVGGVSNRGCSGLEYVDVALGRAHFTLHSRSLPWDHAAGMLLVVEAGGVAAFLDGSPYDPRILDRKPLAAANAEAWRLVHDIVTAPPPGP